MPTLAPPHKALSQKDILFARESARPANLKGSSKKGAFDLQINGNRVPAGSYLSQIVRSCLELIAEGHPVTVVPVEDEIGTQEAADMLKVSRSYLLKLLDANALPSRKVGVQRRVKIQDLLAYQAREKQARIKVLEELAAEGQRLNLGVIADVAFGVWMGITPLFRCLTEDGRIEQGGLVGIDVAVTAFHLKFSRKPLRSSLSLCRLQMRGGLSPQHCLDPLSPSAHALPRPPPELLKGMPRHHASHRVAARCYWRHYRPILWREVLG
jgi:excisionase family DNA binding protein